MDITVQYILKLLRGRLSRSVSDTDPVGSVPDLVIWLHGSTSLTGWFSGFRSGSEIINHGPKPYNFDLITIKNIYDSTLKSIMYQKKSQ